MYNGIHSNPMIKFNQFMKHKGHLQRLYLSKSIIDNKSPIIPSFLQKGIRNKGTEIERRFKINNDNNVLLNKLINIEHRKPKYKPYSRIPNKCPAFERKDEIQIKNFKNIINENYSFYKILKRSKSTFDSSKIEEDYLNSRYYKYNICKNKSTLNPNILFATYRQFDKNIKNALRKKCINKNINMNKIKNHNKRYESNIEDNINQRLPYINI